MMNESMDIAEARELLKSPIWEKVRDIFLETGELHIYPSGDMRRLEYLDAETRKQIELWMDAIEKADSWRRVIDGASVRRLKAEYPGIYPEVFRYTAYFTGKSREAALPLLLKLKFPEAYNLCSC